MAGANIVGSRAIFEFTLPRRFNPTADDPRGRPIPGEVRDEIMQRLRGRWRYGMWLSGGGWSPGTIEPQDFFRVNIPVDGASNAWEWFREFCRWAADQLGQDNVYQTVLVVGPSATGFFEYFWHKTDDENQPYCKISSKVIINFQEKFKDLDSNISNFLENFIK